LNIYFKEAIYDWKHFHNKNLCY